MTKSARGVRSMTGFGAAGVAITGGRLTIELRSVNQRFLDVRVTAPREYAPWEATCREIVGKHVARGRVEVYVGRNAPARGRQGARRDREFLPEIARLLTIERAIRAHAATVAGELQTKVHDRLQGILKASTVDPARVAQEVAYLAERSDVTEELVRLRSHLDELRKLLTTGGPCGKQIEFLLQETHREINTIGSKVNQLEITRLVVEAKGEVERLREQVQNVE